MEKFITKTWVKHTMKSLFYLFFCCISFFSGLNTVYAACTPGGTAGDDDVTCTGSINSFQYFYGGSDIVTLNNVTEVTYNNSYWLDESLGGNPETDGDDTFIAHGSEFHWVLGFGGDDTFEVYDSTFRNLYGDTNPGHGVSQRGNDTILLESSYSNGWILGGNDSDSITIRNSEVSFVAAGYSDIYGDTDYTPFDGNDTVLLDNVNFTAENYHDFYKDRPGAVEGGKGYDYISFINGGEAYNVTGGHGNDTITVSGNVHFNACTFTNDLGNEVDCGIYGDEPYSSEPDPTTIPVRHGNDLIIIYEADLTAVMVNGGHGSDIAVIKSPVIITDTVIDGGDDRGTTDGFADQLTFEQWHGEINGSNVKNWETIVFTDNTEISFADTTLKTGFDDGINPVTGFPYGLIIQNGSYLKQVHDFEVDGNLHNKSVIDLQDGGPPGTVLTVTDNYSSAGRLYLDTVLDNGAPAISDQLVVNGDTTGETTLFINNIGGTGGQTPDGENSGILVVQVNGESDGTFILGRNLTAGKYSYNLTKGENGNWYLQSEEKFFWPLFVPAITSKQR